jgi:hypothetical protein
MSRAIGPTIRDDDFDDRAVVEGSRSLVGGGTPEEGDCLEWPFVGEGHVCGQSDDVAQLPPWSANWLSSSCQALGFPAGGATRYSCA